MIENWIGKYCRGQVENAAVIDFDMSESQTEDVLATSLQLVDEQVLYPIQELLRTWWAIITKHDPHAMYCKRLWYSYGRSGGNEIAVSSELPGKTAFFLGIAYVHVQLERHTMSGECPVG